MIALEHVIKMLFEKSNNIQIRDEIFRISDV